MGTIAVELYAIDGSDFPTGSVLSSGSIDWSSINPVGDPQHRATYDIAVSMSAFSMVSETKYVVVLTPSNLSTHFPYSTLQWMYLGGYTYSGGKPSYHRTDDVPPEGWVFSPTTADLEFSVSGDAPSLSKPTTPTPTNNATEVDFTGFQLSWVNGGGATAYKIYIGPSGSLVQVGSQQSGTNYITTLSELQTIFAATPINQKIYWRADATDGATWVTGDEWNFDARPAKATTPGPANSATGIARVQDLTWV
ncbi:hypothetical protein IMZ48_26240 [Candidatus Bathyarchaeota archaeon]|nr:hypothetical protein [Candidatus Bathyarchaeota archaeon]